MDRKPHTTGDLVLKCEVFDDDPQQNTQIAANRSDIAARVAEGSRENSHNETMTLQMISEAPRPKVLTQHASAVPMNTAPSINPMAAYSVTHLASETNYY
ncbi:uncharacterized protein LOC142985192 isoform X2 [Anticarsia gemmatalis]